MKKSIGWALLIVLIISGISAWLIFGSNTAFSEAQRYFIVEQGKTDRASILAALKENGIVSQTIGLSMLGTVSAVWPKVKPGKYEVKKGQSAFDIARMLRNGKQAELKLVINKLRTKSDLAKLISKQFNTDSVTVMQFLQSNDSLQQLGTDTTQLFTTIIPDTYIFYWNTP